MLNTVALAALAAFVCGCQQELLTDCITVRDDSRQAVAIEFDNGITESHVATRAMLPLSECQYTMGVWGWRTDEQTDSEPLFINQLVSYSGMADSWTYSPPKYWERHSSYRFYAYSPHITDARAAGAKVTIDRTAGLISIDGVTLHGDNIRRTGASHELENNFAASADIDWMITRQEQTASGRIPDKVQFVMNHILAKLNVRIRAGESILSAGTGTTALRLDSLSIGTFRSSGRFEQKTGQSDSEWTVPDSGARVSLHSGTGIPVDAQYTYVVESLVLPQSIDGSQMLRLRYSMTGIDNRTEHFDYELPLLEAFGVNSDSGADGHFRSGNSYTLSITISPDIITYNAGTSGWNEAN